MEEAENIYRYDEFFCNAFACKYIKQNSFRGNVKSKTTKWVQGIYFSGSSSSAGPVCECTVNAAGVKCYDGECLLKPLKVECHTSCGPHCQNQIISRGNFRRNVQIKCVDCYGTSIIAKNAIPARVPIIEYIGLMQEGQVHYKEQFCYPIARFQNRMHIHIHQKKQGNESRFLHHSENPNCNFEEWIVAKEIRVIIVSNKPIGAGDVLTVKFPQRDSEKKQNFLPTKGALDGEFVAEVKKSKATVNAYRKRFKIKPPRKEDEKKEDFDNPFQCRSSFCKFEAHDEDELHRHYLEVHQPQIPLPDGHHDREEIELKETRDYPFEED